MGDYASTSELEERIRLLEARLAGLDKSESNSDLARHDSTANPAAEEVQEPSGHLTLLTNANTIPEVRKCNFTEFKNRFSEKEGRYAVDVLVSGPLLDQEIQEEQRFRDRRSESKKITSRDARRKDDAITKAENRRTINALSNVQSNTKWIRRIRLQSPALLKMLSKIQGEPWSNRLRTYERPFTSLIYFHSRMRERLDELEKRWGVYLDGGHSPATTGASTRDLTNDAEDPIDDCPAALAILRCYVRFFDREVMPEYTQFEGHNFSTGTSIRFTDLWYLFRTGELIYRQPEGGLSRQKDFRTAKRIWRTYCIRPCDAQCRLSPLDHRKYDKMGAEGDESAAFAVRAYYLEYTGEEFCVMTKTFIIPPFKDSISITSLPVFPIRFLPDWKPYLETTIKTGDKILSYIEDKHACYNGWTVIRNPAGDPVTDANGVAFNHAEHINSDVMVDFSEAFQACPLWKPKRVILKQQTPGQKVDSDDFPIIWWPDRDRTKAVGETTEVIPVVTGVSIWQQNEFLANNHLLSKMIENDRRGQLTTRDQLSEEDKALITDRVFAYIFQERKFALLEAQKLWPSVGTQDALESLRIFQSTKDMIQSAVHGHLIQKAAERLDGRRRDLDVISGKGGGLFILLHGVPGVGKTATAEAIAQVNGKPLFKITCGDLGLTPDKVESSLKEIFRLAALWDCILLLDEVDTFFSQRSKGDGAMHKNALVSVFLRIMDYYTGILFLTTNRAGALDEAFKSRIHCKIYYPPLTKNQTLEIWRNNLRRLKRLDEEQSKKEGRRPLEIPESDIIWFAEDQYESAGPGHRKKNRRWNGRQIRNAFQVARSLAYADAAKEAERMRGSGSSDEAAPAPRLEVKHFQLMDDITDSFEKYMEEVHAGMTDGDIARENETRADQFRDYWNVRTQPEDFQETHGHGRAYFNAKSPPPRPAGRSKTLDNTQHFNVTGQVAGAGPGVFSMARYSSLRDQGSSGVPDELLPGQGLFHRYSEDKTGYPRPAHSFTNPSILIRGASPPSQREYRESGQRSPVVSPRFTSNSSLYGRGRDTSGQRDMEDDLGYLEAKNQYGKRERQSEELGLGP